MLKYKIKVKHLDDAPLLEPYFYGYYPSEYGCRDSAVELSKLGYKVDCYEQGKNGMFFLFKEYKARVN